MNLAYTYLAPELRTYIQMNVDMDALFVINHSGGKDSQAMAILMRDLVPLEQLVIVHAHLPEVEWDGTVEHIEATAQGVPVYVCQARKTFFQMVEHRQMFPDPQRRQCTSDLKRGPLEKLIRRLSKETGRLRIVNCMGMRAEESNSRAKKAVIKYSVNNSAAGRIWEEFLPIHRLLTSEVFEIIRLAGQKPFWTYAEGMTRKSCSFCIMASEHDLRIAARLRPTLGEHYCQLEERLGFTMRMDKTPLRTIIQNSMNS